MWAVVLAGGVPGPSDPLHRAAGGGPKALIEVGGRSMVQRVVDAVGGAQAVHGVVVVGADQAWGLVCAKPLCLQPAGDDIVDNVTRGVCQVLAAEPATERVIVVAADVPLLRPEHVDWFAGHIAEEPADIHYGVVAKRVMEARFPSSRRSYVPLRGGTYCGADVHASTVAALFGHEPTWRALLERRKSPARQAGVIGWSTLLLAAMRVVSIDQVVARASRSLGVEVRAVVWPFAEAGMDVDKPQQLEMVRAELG
jgi:molybdopterin-guanine dinucleotide biosynthesis protein A